MNTGYTGQVGHRVKFLLETDLSWQHQALCVGRPINLFYPEKNSDNRKGNLLPTERKAKALCARCPVRKECLEMGMTQEFGIWGGTTPGERVRARRYQKAVRVDRLLEDMDDQAEELGLVAMEEAS